MVQKNAKKVKKVKKPQKTAILHNLLINKCFIVLIQIFRKKSRKKVNKNKHLGA